MRAVAPIVAALALLGASGAAATGGRAAVPAFRAQVTPIDAPLRSRLTSWRRGCPVAVVNLRLVTMTHWGLDGRVHRGRLIVNEDVAADVVRAFRRVYTARFPIRRMELVERYGSDDDRSMAADNTSGFNCRRVPGGTWSEHAYGRAIDVNPLENPEIRGGVVMPPRGVRFVRRSQRAPGMIHARDAVVRAFASIGWKWGGYWRSLKDYQHFSATGR
jgi:hypothetical protein